MKKITLRQTYKLCSELWTWLGNNPTQEKIEWSGWNRFLVNRNNIYIKNLCFACEYDLQKGSIFTQCFNCPLIELWGDDCVQSYKSPYRKWTEAKSTKVKRRNAFKIADFCDKKLEELKNKKGA